MNKIMQIISDINSKVNGVVWGVPMLILIIGTGIYMTVRTGFFQIVRTKLVAKETIFKIFREILPESQPPLRQEDRALYSGCGCLHFSE